MIRRKFILAGAVAAASPAFGAGPLRVRIASAIGDIVLDLAANAAPLTVANFLRYVDGGLYDGASFYRVVEPGNDTNPVPIEVIQGGVAPRATALPPIAHETTKMTGLRHTDGVISLARDAPGTGDSEFFICVGDNPALDFGGRRNPDGQGFAAFGHVSQGMDVVRAIHAMKGAPGSGEGPLTGQILARPVRIVSVRRV